MPTSLTKSAGAQPIESEKQKELLENLTELAACRQSVLYFFLNYAFIEDNELKRVVRWQPWPFLVRLLDTFLEKKEIIILKSRRLGISWLVCGYSVWLALFSENVNVLMLSKGQDEAWELIRKCRFIYNKLPLFLKRKINSERRDLLEFEENNSRIKALPSTEDAGTSYSATLVVRDELEKHPYAAQNFAAVGPVVDSGGQLIELSTTRRDKQDTHFKKRYREARSGENGAFPVFLSVRERKDRDPNLNFDEWWAKIQKKYPKWQLEEEYPETEEQALSSISSMAFFDKNALDGMMMDKQEPIEVRHSCMVKIWKRPVVGRTYFAFLDPSDGSEDPHYIPVFDSRTYEVVAQSWGKCSADEAARIFDELVREYNNAFNDFELNSLAGGKVSQTLDDLQTPNRRKSGKSKEGKPKYGWYTSSNNRPTMLWGLEEAVRNRLITVHDICVIQEMQEFMRPEGEEPCAPSGGHDDTVFGLAGAWQIRRDMPTQTHFKTGWCKGYER